ncbi:hypothetical protein GCM10023238_17730 [Streptomyces heliomycini]
MNAAGRRVTTVLFRGRVRVAYTVSGARWGNRAARRSVTGRAGVREFRRGAVRLRVPRHTAEGEAHGARGQRARGVTSPDS